MHALLYKILGPFQILSAMLTLPGAVAAITIGIAVILLLMATSKGRLCLIMAMLFVFVLTQTTSRSGGTKLPGFITLAAINFRWLTIVPLSLMGFCFLINGQGMKMGFFATLLPLFLYILGCCFFSTGLPRYIMWIFMWVGVISATIEIILRIGIEKIFKYWLIVSYILIILNLLVTITSPGKAFLASRYCGMMTNPNGYGFLGLILLPPLFWATFEKKKKNPFNYACLGFLAFTIIISGSRAGVFSLIPLILVVLFIYIKRPGLMLAVGFLTIIVAVALMFLANPEVVSRLASTQSSGRVEMWKFLWPKIISAPFGNGIGWIDSNMESAPHNSYLWMATEAGYFWAIVFFSTILAICLHGGLRKKYYETPESYRIKLLLLMTLVGVVFTGVFESWLVGIGGFHLPFFLFIIGMKEGLLAYQKQKYANPIEAQYQMADEGNIYMPVFLVKRDYYMKNF